MEIKRLTSNPLLLFVLSVTAFLLIPDSAEALDKVFLKDGTMIEGDITHEDDRLIVIKTSSGEVQIQARDVSNIQRVQPSWAELFIRTSDAKKDDSFISEEERKKILEKHKEETGEGDQPRAPLTDVPKKSSLFQREFPRADEALEKEILEKIKALKEEKIKPESKAFFKTNADAAAPYLVLYIFDPKEYWVAFHGVELLGELKREDAVKYLIEALWAMTPEEGAVQKPPQHMIDLMDKTQEALISITGQRIYASPESPYVRKEITQWQQWYSLNYMKLPPQIGEPEISAKKDSKEYAKKLEKIRRLDLSLNGILWPLPPAKKIVDLNYKWPPIDPDTRQKLSRAVEQIASDDKNTRRVGENELAVLSKKLKSSQLVLYLTAVGLTHPSKQVQLAAMRTLGEHPTAAKVALKFIIEAMMKRVKKDSKLSPEDYAFAKAAYKTLQKISGKPMRYPTVNSASVYKKCYLWVEWYQKNRVNPTIIPLQLGAPKLDPTSESYGDDYRKIQSLNLPELPAE